VKKSAKYYLVFKTSLELTFRSMNVAMFWERTAETPVTAASFEGARVEISELYRLVRGLFRARNQGSALCTLLRGREWGCAVTQAHIVPEQQVFAFGPSPGLALVPLLDITDSDAVLFSQFVAVVVCDNKMCCASTVRPRRWSDWLGIRMLITAGTANIISDL
jgi:hypothetical protein